jgi:hypothetical protein
VATAVGRRGQSLSVGDDWSPEALLSLGAESDLMTTFIGLANEASLQVLGYVSAGQFVDVADEGRRLAISVCIVVGSAADEAMAEETWSDARTNARLAGMLGSQVTVEAAIMVVGAEAALLWRRP